MAEVDAQRAALAARGDRVPFLGGWMELVPEPGRNRVTRTGERLLAPLDPGERTA